MTDVDTAFVVPYVETDPARARNYEAVRCYLRETFPGWPVVTGVPYGDDWSKGEAVGHAVDILNPQVSTVIVHDADVFVPDADLRAAVAAVTAGAAWAIPHQRVCRLTEETTVATLAGAPPVTSRLTRPAYVGVRGGGIVVVDRPVLEGCPLDVRFHGWGSEDEAWGWALTTLHGPPVEGVGDLVHLWHPHPAPGQRRSPLPESNLLWRRYRAYRRDAGRMKDLVAEAVEAFAGIRPRH